jgi:hypothetical protein
MNKCLSSTNAVEKQQNEEYVESKYKLLGKSMELFETSLMALDIEKKKGPWYFDLKAFHHVTSNNNSLTKITKEIFQMLGQVKGNEYNHSVETKNNAQFELLRGEVNNITNVLYVPRFIKNLQFVGKFANKKLNLSFNV